ncbi:helix-turn-helix transcriptional regulator [Natrialba taiwanensis]|uniref:HTH iclR-type domain-containing protein n=1 Tax=Natrialba taiwanensis DSM 12281 TaxID=1230458 RepID=M0A863_9EURY|nr:hypothetical protein [Natrialba taiwanensis]ELY94072.1 hypothetical protein C484_06599 [Natrialba taiwanensis DSM 12281]
MRLSTAGTLALIALLATTSFGSVAAAPSARAGTPSAGIEQPQATVEQSPTASTAEAATLADSYGNTEKRYAYASYGDQLDQIIRINVTDDGDTHWAIEHRVILDDEDEVDAFTDYAAAVTDGQRDADTDFPIQEFRQQASEASNSTNQDMSITDAGWNEYDVKPYEDAIETDDTDSTDYESAKIGIISYTFTWTNFATIEGDRIYFGEALQTDSNDYVISTLSSGQRLVIESPDNYGLDTPTQLTWNGPHEFSENELEIVFLRGAQPSTGIWGLITDGPVLAVIALVGIIAIIVLGRAVASRNGKTWDEVRSSLEGILSFERDESPDGEPGVAADSDAVRSGTESTGPPREPAADVPSEGEGTQFEFTEPVNEDIDPELLSDEERVQRMLTRNGGRMKQAAIVSETGWSNAKVSQLLSQMDEDDQIEKLRIGRENLITLPEVDPTEID